MKTDRLLLAVALGLAMAIAGLGLVWKPDLPERPLVSAPPILGGDFTVQSADGLVSLNDFRGKLVLLYFGYTYCPDVCPTALVSVAEAVKQLGPEEAARVAVLFISVDPKRDTPARLKEYATFFLPTMIGATASPADIAAIARRYGVIYAEQKVATAGDGYVVDHSSDTFLIGPAGNLLGKLAHGTTPADIAAAIRRAFNQPSQ